MPSKEPAHNQDHKVVIQRSRKPSARDTAGNTKLPFQPDHLDPKSLTQAQVLQLQRTIGNGSLRQLLAQGSSAATPIGPRERPSSAPELLQTTLIQRGRTKGYKNERRNRARQKQERAEVDGPEDTFGARFIHGELNAEQQGELEDMRATPASVDLSDDGKEVFLAVDDIHGEERRFAFSLARHWFPVLDAEGKDLNSVMHHNLTIPEILKDCRDLGQHLKTVWEDPALEPKSTRLTCSSGREYIMDATGSSGVINHFYVISGPKVAGQLSANAYRFFREVSKWQGSGKGKGQVQSELLNVEDELTPEAISRVAGIDVYAALEMKTKPEREGEKADNARFVADIRAFIAAGQLQGLPTSYLKPDNWVKVSELDYARASEAYKRLFAAHKLHFTKGKGGQVLDRIDD